MGLTVTVVKLYEGLRIGSMFGFQPCINPTAYNLVVLCVYLFVHLRGTFLQLIIVAVSAIGKYERQYCVYKQDVF